MILKSDIPYNTKIWRVELVNIYNSYIGENCNIGAFVEIGNSTIGNNCKIQAHSFICTAEIGNNVFVGPRVTFTNVKYPSAIKQGEFNNIIVEDDVTIGAGAIILPGIKLGRGCFVGAGSVVTKDVIPFTVVYGNPAKEREI